MAPPDTLDGWLPQLRAATEVLRPAFENITNHAVPRLPVGAGRLVEKAATRFKIQTLATGEDVGTVLGLFAAYELNTSIREFAELLCRVPYTGNETLYHSVRTGIHFSYFVLQRSGDSLAAESLRPFLQVPDYEPFESILSYLGDAFSPRSFVNAYTGKTMRGGIAARHALWPLPLAAMAHTFGGSPLWSRRRIENGIELNLAFVRGLRSFEPVAGSSSR
jgi:hypothetical protein